MNLKKVLNTEKFNILPVNKNDKIRTNQFKKNFLQKLRFFFFNFYENQIINRMTISSKKATGKVIHLKVALERVKLFLQTHLIPKFLAGGS